MFEMVRPVHPGDFIKNQIIDGYNLSITDAAAALGVTRQALSSLINKHTSLSKEMAMRIEKAFGFDMDTLLRMQVGFDIFEARVQFKNIKVKRFKLAASNRQSLLDGLTAFN